MLHHVLHGHQSFKIRDARVSLMSHVFTNHRRQFAQRASPEGAVWPQCPVPLAVDRRCVCSASERAARITHGSIMVPAWSSPPLALVGEDPTPTARKHRAPSVPCVVVCVHCRLAEPGSLFSHVGSPHDGSSYIGPVRVANLGSLTFLRRRV